ncbi:MAG: zinc ribbon domain-containing protein [Anaerolineales bacterium]
MARKVKGYVELYWKCPSCANENLGSHAYCTSCGSPQPRNVDFHQGSKQQLITDPERLKRAKAGADIHCGYCGTRNPANAVNCAQCGADLKQGARRGAGKVLGAFSAGAVEPVTCANCGTLNAGTRLKCGNCGSALAHGAPPPAAKRPLAAQPVNRNALLIGGGVLLLIIATIYFLFIRTQAVVGTVTSANWSRSVVIEAFGPLQLEDWRDELPGEARNPSCQEEVREVQSDPPSTGRYDEVCGTEYVVDTGSGAGEVVQDCEYRVYDDYCSYTIDAWAPVSTAEVEGIGLSVAWPMPALASNQRLGEQKAAYACVFGAGGKSYTYRAENFEEFQICVVGSTWNLEVNALGAVTSISPAN